MELSANSERHAADGGANASRAESPAPQPQREAAPKQQKRKIDVGTKLVLAREARASSINAVARKYDVARENVRRWIRCEAQLEALAVQQQQTHGDGATARMAYRLHGGGRKISYEAMDQELASKVFEQRASGQRVTRRLIEDWARELKEQLQVGVVVCPTWVSRFMKRHGISLTKGGAVAPTDPSASDQLRPKRVVVSAADKLAIMHFFENSNRDMQKTLLKFYGHIADPKLKQVKARNIYNWLHKRDEIALRAHKERQKSASKAAAVVAAMSGAMDGSGGVVLAPRQRVAAAAARGQSSVNATGGEPTGESSTAPAAGEYNDSYEYQEDDGDDDTLDDGDYDDEEDDDDDTAGRSFGFGAAQARGSESATPERQSVLELVAPPPFPLPRPLPKIVAPPQQKQKTAAAAACRQSAGSERRQSTESAAEVLASPEQAHQTELRRHKREIAERQAALRETKERLIVESLRCNNVLKRIKIAEENMLARKRLKDAGIAQEEIDALLPVVRVAPPGAAPEL